MIFCLFKWWILLFFVIKFKFIFNFYLIVFTAKIFVFPNITAASLMPIIMNSLLLETINYPVIVTTDGFAVYNGLNNIEHLGTVHRVVFHEYEWKFGLWTTNPIETLWVWVK